MTYFFCDHQTSSRFIGDSKKHHTTRRAKAGGKIKKNQSMEKKTILHRVKEDDHMQSTTCTSTMYSPQSVHNQLENVKTSEKINVKNFNVRK